MGRVRQVDDLPYDLERRRGGFHLVCCARRRSAVGARHDAVTVQRFTGSARRCIQLMRRTLWQGQSAWSL